MRLLFVLLFFFSSASFAIPRYEVETEFWNETDSQIRTKSIELRKIDDETWLWEGLESLGETEIDQSVRYIELEDGFEIRLRLKSDAFDINSTTTGLDPRNLYEYSTTVPQVKIDDGTGTEWIPTFKIRSVDSF